MKTLSSVAALLLLFVTPPALAAEPNLPAPLKLRYALTYGGVTTGQVTLTLKRESDGSYKRVSHSRPEGMARMFTTVEWVDESHFDIVQGQVRPRTYVEYRVGAERSHKQSASFDWKAGLVRYQFGNSTASLPVGAQDQGSLLFAWMLQPPAAGPERTLHLSSGKKLKEVRYSRVGSEKLKTVYGLLNTIVLERRPAPGDKDPEAFRVWLASDHHNLPIRMTTEKRGQDTALILESASGIPGLGTRPSP